MYPLRKNKGPTKVQKMCMYCGHMAGKVMSAAVNCPKCKKRGLRTIIGRDQNGDVRVVGRPLDE
jgi:ribosomal protein L40E